MMGVFAFMLKTLRSEDRIKLARGLLAMLIAIIAGVVVVDMQLNSLTHQHEFVQLLNLRRDPRDGYSAYFFGNSYPIGAVFPLTHIENTQRELIFEAGDITLRIPTKVSFNMTRVMYWLRVWSRQFVEEAYKTKAFLTKCIAELSAEVSDYGEQMRYLLQGESSK